MIASMCLAVLLEKWVNVLCLHGILDRSSVPENAKSGLRVCASGCNEDFFCLWSIPAAKCLNKVESRHGGAVESTQ